MMNTELCNELYTNNLVKILDKYGLNLDIFKRTQLEMFIGGSSIVQSILSEEWEDSDLDIYIKGNDFAGMANKLYKNGYNLNSSTSEYASMQIYKFGKYHETLLNKLGNSLSLNIDVVVVNGTFEDFFNKFDLDMCKSRFNGTNFFIKNEEDIKKKITNYEYHDVWAKDKNIISSSVKKMLIISRMAKYKSRGFTINNLDEYYDPKIKSKYENKDEIVDEYKKLFDNTMSSIIKHK